MIEMGIGRNYEKGMKRGMIWQKEWERNAGKRWDRNAQKEWKGKKNWKEKWEKNRWGWNEKRNDDASIRKGRYKERDEKGIMQKEWKGE